MFVLILIVAVTSSVEVTSSTGINTLNITAGFRQYIYRVHTQMTWANFRTLQHHKHQKIRPTVLPLTTFYVVLIRKHGSENVARNILCWFIIIINAGKLNCKNYSITDLVFQEQIHDFFSTSVQFQDFSGTEKSKLKFQDFSGPVGTLIYSLQCINLTTLSYGNWVPAAK